jgi:transposase-like protein
MGFPVSFLKVEISIPELKKAIEGFKQSRVKMLNELHAEFRLSVAETLNQLLNAEMALFLGEPEQCDNKRNGFQTREFALKGVGSIQLKVPADRKRRFNSAIVPKRERIDPRLREDLAALHLAGLSTRTLSLMSERILGIEVSHQTVSESLPMLAEHAQKWLVRPIEGDWWALLVDGTNFKVRRRGSVEKEPMLVVLGIDRNNRRSILAIEPGHRDSSDCWQAVFRSLKGRGLDPKKVQIGVMDGLPGLEGVFTDEFPNAVTARCWFHALQNVLAKAPKRLKEPLHELAKKVMYADSEASARSAFRELECAMAGDCERAVRCLAKDLDSLVSHYRFPSGVQHALKTTNAVERIHKEFKRRSRAMEGVGEMTLTTLVAFTALRLEMGWRRRAVDSFEVAHLVGRKPKLPVVEVLESGSIVH